jgi:hypothetical protein
MEVKGHKVSSFLRLIVGLAMLGGGFGIIMLSVTVAERASDADWSPAGQGLLIMLAGLVVAVIGSIVTVICFVRAIRGWQADEALKGRFRTRILALVPLLLATGVSSFLLCTAPYPPLISLPISLGVLLAAAVIGAYAQIALPRPRQGQLSLALCVPLVVTAGVVIAVVSSPMSPQRLVRQYQSGKRNFQEFELPGADLRGADLRGANLEWADLRGADLRGANLRGARLREANLTDADLTDANLMDAQLPHSNLSRADLRGANLSGANLYEAIMPDGTVHP